MSGFFPPYSARGVSTTDIVAVAVPTAITPGVTTPLLDGAGTLRRSRTFTRIFGDPTNPAVSSAQVGDASLRSVTASVPLRSSTMGSTPMSSRASSMLSAITESCAGTSETPGVEDGTENRPSSTLSSTIGLARDVSYNAGLPYSEVEKWIRDGWTHLNTGTLIVNCTLVTSFSSSHSLDEVVPFQRWIRAVVDCSLACGRGKCDIVCMGIPSINVTNGVVRSIGKLRRCTLSPHETG